jgi:hypothetical protein
MKGTLHKTEQGWVVEYAKHSELPLHPDDIRQIEEAAKVFDNIEARIAAYSSVEFEIIDEFTHPELFTNVGWGDSIKYAKLMPSKEQQKQLITEIMDLDAKDGLYEHIGDVNKMIEVSDEEIEKAMEKHINNDLDLYESLVDGHISYNTGIDLLNNLFIAGAKWYREQLKNKQ